MRMSVAMDIQERMLRASQQQSAEMASARHSQHVRAADLEADGRAVHLLVRAGHALRLRLNFRSDLFEIREQAPWGMQELAMLCRLPAGRCGRLHLRYHRNKRNLLVSNARHSIRGALASDAFSDAGWHACMISVATRSNFLW